MNNQFLKLFAFIAIIGLAFTSCQKEEEFVPQEDQSVFRTAEKTEIMKLEETAFSSTKTIFTEKQVFLNGGVVIISYQYLTTKIVGDQRWCTMDYSGYISGTVFNNENTIHHSYDAAMSLNGSTTLMNIASPTNLVELSNWRIPSWDDLDHLHNMVYGDIASKVTGLNMQATGMVKWDGVNASVHQNPTYGIFWCSDFVLGNQGQDTWHLFGNSAPDHTFSFQYQLQYPYAPIRLVQDVEPIQ